MKVLIYQSEYCECTHSKIAGLVITKLKPSISSTLSLFFGFFYILLDHVVCRKMGELLQVVKISKLSITFLVYLTKLRVNCKSLLSLSIYSFVPIKEVLIAFFLKNILMWTGTSLDGSASKWFLCSVISQQSRITSKPVWELLRQKSDPASAENRVELIKSDTKTDTLS